MAISANQVDKVIKAYSKQQKSPLLRFASLDGPAVAPSDNVMLSGNRPEDDAYQKISYTLLDLLKK